MYSFVLDEQQDVRIDVLFEDAQGDLDIVLRSAQGNPVRLVRVLRIMSPSTEPYHGVAIS